MVLVLLFPEARPVPKAPLKHCPSFCFRSRLGLLACLPLFLLCGSAKSSPPEDAFIWQRAWSPALDAAVAGNADIVRRWHVLAAQMDHGNTLAAYAVHWARLARTGNRLVPVLRINGPLPADPAPIVSFWNTLPATARQALEIDYDSPTAGLAQYAAFLRALRAALPPATQLSATMLPDWLHADDFPLFSGAVDGLVLQVHAVQAPSRGLFDQGRALAWARRTSQLTRTPFLIAVPDYALRVQFAANGTPMAAAAEMPSPPLAGARTIAAAPEDVAAFLASLSHAGLAHCAGIVWFRLPLPTASDAGTPSTATANTATANTTTPSTTTPSTTTPNTATWSTATWRQVALGTPLLPRLVLTQTARPAPAPPDILLRNTGNTDILAPQNIPLPDCVFFDGIAPYHRAGQMLAAESRPWIRPGKTLRAGRARYEAP